MNKYNYSLVYCDKMGVNAFFINNKYLDICNIANINNINKIYRFPKYGNGPNGGHINDNKNRKYISYNDAINLD